VRSERIAIASPCPTSKNVTVGTSTLRCENERIIAAALGISNASVTAIARVRSQQRNREDCEHARRR
jgi:hypothetical protein